VHAEANDLSSNASESRYAVESSMICSQAVSDCVKVSAATVVIAPGVADITLWDETHGSAYVIK
jgi:hypothetical protein